MVECEICGINDSKYSCPKCQVAYCSVSCYQSENHLQCSEIFYEQWVQEELKNSFSDAESKRKLLDIIRETQEATLEETLDSDDEEAVPDLASRMRDVNLDDEETVWSKLTTEERREFWKLMATGNILTVLPEQEPWWKIWKEKQMVRDIDENLDWTIEIPIVPYEIPELQKLTKVNPSPYVPFMFLNVLISYVYTVRLFKGVHKVLPVESISTCIALSVTLKNNAILKNPIEAFAAFEKSLSECKWIKGAYDGDQIQGDLKDIIKDGNGSFFCLKAAICDVSLMCSQALDILRKNNCSHLKRFSGSPPKVGLLQHVSRKMNYYLSWVPEYGSSLLNNY